MTPNTTMLLRRSAAALGAASGVLHLVMIVHGPLLLSVTMALAAVVCLPCAGHLWRRSSLTTWVSVGVMNLLMVLLHLAIMTIGGPETADSQVTPVEQAHSHHQHLTWGIDMPLHTLFVAATVIAATEVVLCSGGLWLCTDRRSDPSPVLD